MKLTKLAALVLAAGVSAGAAAAAHRIVLTGTVVTPQKVTKSSRIASFFSVVFGVVAERV